MSQTSLPEHETTDTFRQKSIVISLWEHCRATAERTIMWRLSVTPLCYFRLWSH